MASSADVVCRLCENQDITQHADHWCPECEKGVCLECIKFHKTSKATKYHEVISVENFKKLPTSISSVTHSCKKHNKRYQKYCTHHGILCCPVCIAENHDTCVGLLCIDDIIKNAKSSSLLESVEESVVFLKRNLQFLLEERDQVLMKNKLQREDFLANIETIRKKTNAHFDKLEQRILGELLFAEKQIREKSDFLLNDLIQKVHAIEELKQEVVLVKEYGSDLQTCLGSISLKRRVEEGEKYLTSIVEDGKVKQTFLKCSLDNNILTEILSVKTFGSVSTEHLSTRIDLNKQLKTRAQIPLLKEPKAICEINFTIKCKFEIPPGESSNCITSCIFRPNGEILFIDQGNSRLLVFNGNGNLERTTYLLRKVPLDLTSVDDKTICVSYGASNRLELIETDSYKTKKVVKTNNGCCGVTSEHGTLYWFEKTRGIQVKKQSSNVTDTLVKTNHNYLWSYVSVYADLIYQSDLYHKQ